MKKGIGIIIPILIVMIVSAFCISSYYFSYKEIKKSKEQANTSINTSSKYMFTDETYPKIMSISPLQILIEKYYNSYTGNTLEGTYNETSDEILKKLINNEIEIAILPTLTKEQIELARKSNIQLETFEFVKDAIVFMTNSSNIVNDIKEEDLIKIYSGNIKNWKELNGEDIEIKAYQKPEKSFIQNYMVSNVMKDKKIIDKVTENIIKEDSAIANINSEYYGESGRIGYTLYNYYNFMYNDVSNGVINSDKLLSINDIAPTNENIASRAYPYTITYYIVINASQPQDGNVRKWIANVISDDGKNIAKEAGYIANR